MCVCVCVYYGEAIHQGTERCIITNIPKIVVFVISKYL